MNRRHYKTNYDGLLHASSCFYPQFNKYNMSPEQYHQHKFTHWGNSGSAVLNCIICDKVIRSTHAFGCPNKGKSNPNPCDCICGLREKPYYDEIPICHSCAVLNEQVAIVIFGKSIKNGHLYRLPKSRRDYTCILYTENDDLTDNIHRSISSESLATDTSSDSASGGITPYDDIFYPKLIRGIDVAKREYGLCYSCGYNSPSMLCLQTDQNNLVRGNIKGLSHIPSQNYVCPICSMDTFVTYKIWDIHSYENLSQNTIEINNTLYDSSQMKFGHNETHRPLNDFPIDGKERNDDRLDDYHKVVNYNKSCILYSCISVTKRMLRDNFKLIISSTQEGIDVLHNFLFGDIDYYTIEEDKLLSWKDGKCLITTNTTSRCPQVSPQTVTQINDFDNCEVSTKKTDVETSSLELPINKKNKIEIFDDSTIKMELS